MREPLAEADLGTRGAEVDDDSNDVCRGRAERGQNVRVDDRADESLARAALLARRAGRCARDDGHAAATWRV